MDRPYIICHMMTALDGKITGKFMNTVEAEKASFVYESTNDSYNPQAWMCGRVTTDENFTFYQEPELDEESPKVPEGDFVAQSNAPMYYISIDASGKMGWTENTLYYAERPAAHIIEVLTERSSNAYRDFLRKKNISYIIAGETELDCSLAMKKLKTLFSIKTLMLSGGGFLNWSFLQEGLIDELSLVIAPVADGNSNTVTLFEKASSLPEHPPIGFNLNNIEAMSDGSIWLRYTVKKDN